MPIATMSGLTGTSPATPASSGSAVDGLGQINTGAGTVGSALSRASAALGTGGGMGGGGGMGAGGMGDILDKLGDNMGGAGIGRPSTVPQPIFKKGGKVSSKGRDWHGFGSSKTGNTNHGF